MGEEVWDGLIPVPVLRLLLSLHLLHLYPLDLPLHLHLLHHLLGLAAAAVGEGHLGVGGGEEGTGLAQPGGVLQAGEAGGDQG